MTDETSDRPAYDERFGRCSRAMAVASICGALLLTATFAFAGSTADSTPGLPGAVSFTADAGETADHVRIAAVDRTPGDLDRATVLVVIDAGFHVNANPASQPYLIPTTLTVTNATPLRVIYPAPALFKPKFSDDALKVYEGTIRVVAEFPHDTLARAPRLFGTLTAQACTADICLPPANLPLSVR